MSFSTPNATVLNLGPSASTFADYHADFTSYLTSFRTNLTTSSSASTPPLFLDAADRDLQEANDLLKSLELEAQTAPASTRSQLATHVTKARSDLYQARTHLREERVRIAAEGRGGERELLFEGVDAGQRKGVVDVTGKLERGGELIQNSRRMAAEAEAVGVGILEDLQSQRQTILRARESVAGVGQGLDQSAGVLGSMQRRAIVNRIIVYVVLGAIGVACLGILYARVFHGREK